jgi:putative transcriptional regulator
MSVRKLVEKTGMTQKQFAEYFGIPFRTLQNWVLGQEKCRDYWIELMQYKLQKEGLLIDTDEDKCDELRHGKGRKI